MIFYFIAVEMSIVELRAARTDRKQTVTSAF